MAAPSRLGLGLRPHDLLLSTRTRTASKALVAPLPAARRTKIDRSSSMRNSISRATKGGKIQETPRADGAMNANMGSVSVPIKLPGASNWGPT